MIKIQIKYKSEEEKIKILKIISEGTNIKKISEPYKKGQYYRVYIDINQKFVVKLYKVSDRNILDNTIDIMIRKY